MRRCKGGGQGGIFRPMNAQQGTEHSNIPLTNTHHAGVVSGGTGPAKRGEGQSVASAGYALIDNIPAALRSRDLRRLAYPLSHHIPMLDCCWRWLASDK